MKTALLSLALAAATLCGGVTAQEPAAPAAAAPVAAVPASLQNLQYITEARPATDAEFYVYLCSASWCPPCRAIMPRIIEQYPAIRAAGGEIILLCFDSTPQAGQAYMKKYGAKFPAIMVNIDATEQPVLPGFTMPNGIPRAVFVTAGGKLISSGHGIILLNWKAITKK